MIGAPPGYVGYEEGGKLTEAVRRRPYCLVLLDEIEKAHPDVAGILLQIMEEGVLTDSTGKRVSFKNTVVVMTSNIGGELKGDGLGFCPTDRAGETQKPLKQHFTPEFLSRLDKILHFAPLEPKTKSAIAEKYLAQLRKRTEEHGITISWGEDLPAYLVNSCEMREGARQLRRAVQDQVEGPLAMHLLNLEKTPGKIKIRVEKDVVLFN